VPAFLFTIFARPCEYLGKEPTMWILIAVIAAGLVAQLWRQWRALLRQLPDCAEHLVLF
jgi:hypothetical protein